MEENNNVVNVKFREPTELEEYIDILQESPPEILVSLTVSQGEMFLNFYGVEDIDSVVGKLERLKGYLMYFEGE